MDRRGDQAFGDQVEGRVLVPGGINAMVGLQRLVTVFAQDDVVIAVPEKRELHGGDADFLVVDEDARPLRIAGDLHRALDAAASDEQGGGGDQDSITANQAGAH